MRQAYVRLVLSSVTEAWPQNTSPATSTIIMLAIPLVNLRGVCSTKLMRCIREAKLASAKGTKRYATALDVVAVLPDILVIIQGDALMTPPFVTRR